MRPDKIKYWCPRCKMSVLMTNTCSRCFTKNLKRKRNDYIYKKQKSICNHLSCYEKRIENSKYCTTHCCKSCNIALITETELYYRLCDRCSLQTECLAKNCIKKVNRYKSDYCYRHQCKFCGEQKRSKDYACSDYCENMMKKNGLINKEKVYLVANQLEKSISEC